MKKLLILSIMLMAATSACGKKDSVEQEADATPVPPVNIAEDTTEATGETRPEPTTYSTPEEAVEAGLAAGTIAISEVPEEEPIDGMYIVENGVLTRANKELEEITVGSEVKSIGTDAFFGCSTLKKLTLPDTLTSIDVGAFSGCTSLESISIPSSVTSIGMGALSDCKTLTSIDLPEGAALDMYIFSGCSALKTVKLPSGMTSIPDGFFQGCSSLESIDIPAGVTSVGQSAFFGCASLKTINFNGNAPILGEMPFDYTPKELSITYPGGASGWDAEEWEIYNCSAR